MMTPWWFTPDSRISAAAGSLHHVDQVAQRCNGIRLHQIGFQIEATRARVAKATRQALAFPRLLQGRG
ncbi:hypothetical protein D8I24_3465 (plasmid) [Cupriavidus necator H850]|uniref:hypothetical protein n=1 Tax=Cupriavidus necator TaxID=106590 RepID=UPI001892C25D|nr:hypothetical protein [Cupriavidus necator]KAI3602164.1 hypothetical protein D8I24_3465 [Cupriavidus necator H850]